MYWLPWLFVLKLVHSLANSPPPPLYLWHLLVPVPVLAYLYGPSPSTLLLVSLWDVFLLVGFHLLFGVSGYFIGFFSSGCAQPSVLNLLPQITSSISSSPNSSLISLLCLLLQTPTSRIRPYICGGILFQKI